MNQKSYCLDIQMGYDSTYREELLRVLKGVAADFEITTCQRSSMDDIKGLRLMTPKASELRDYIVETIRTGDDNNYVVHYSEVDAQRSMSFLPDFDDPLGYREFAISSWVDAVLTAPAGKIRVIKKGPLSPATIQVVGDYGSAEEAFEVAHTHGAARQHDSEPTYHVYDHTGTCLNGPVTQ